MTPAEEVQRRRAAAAEEQLGEAEHATEDRLHALAERLPDPEEVHLRADALSRRADGHLARAERLRTEPR